MRPPIYEPKGKAKEYGDLALNIYTGCPHECFYCFAPSVLHKEKEKFHTGVMPRPGIVEETKKQLEKEGITDKLIHLCFTCDPFPTGVNNEATREIIKLLKEHGNHVQILTKGDGRRDFDLLDGKDWFGVTISSMGERATKAEPGAAFPELRLCELEEAKLQGIKTWVSFEPVICAEDVIGVLDEYYELFDKVKIGKLNYHRSDIDWARFGRDAETICQKRGLEYYIKESLRAEMEKMA